VAIDSTGDEQSSQRGFIVCEWPLDMSQKFEARNLNFSKAMGSCPGKRKE
jgi:hypothetical protein